MLFPLAVVLVFVIALLVILPRLGQAPRGLVIPLGALGLLLVIASTVYFFLARPPTPPVVSSLEELRALEDGSRVILAGRVSPMMPPVHETHAAYVSAAGRRTPELIIELRGGIVPLSNTDYAAARWPGGVGQYLDRGDAVVVTGVLEHWITPLGECPYAGSREAEFMYIRADQVFYGTVDEYAAHTRNAALRPTVTAAAGWGVGVEVMAAALVIWLARRVRGGEAQEGAA